jgi:hypothetical protein
MLSKEENAFIGYWEKNRLRRKKTVRQFLLGIPAGLLIVVPIVINFGSGWYRRANMEANSDDFNPMVLFVALLLIVGFTAIFWQRHQWDQLEQRYRELLLRRAREMAPAADKARPGPAGVLDGGGPERSEASMPSPASMPSESSMAEKAAEAAASKPEGSADQDV